MFQIFDGDKGCDNKSFNRTIMKINQFFLFTECEL